ncbi:hypothetical protein ABVC70_08795 [Hoylesella timonensis]|uniref:hypothetical protein n=1 Tax=Hoylesella timonensis TaxID=386414 RepID=UPI003369CD76
MLNIEQQSQLPAEIEALPNCHRRLPEPLLHQWTRISQPWDDLCPFYFHAIVEGA